MIKLKIIKLSNIYLKSKLKIDIKLYIFEKMNKYSSKDDKEYFISHCFKLTKFTFNNAEPIFGCYNFYNGIAYNFINKFFTLLEKKSGFWCNRDTIIRNLDKMYFLNYDILEEDYIKSDDKKLTNILPYSKYEDLILDQDKYRKIILVGFAMIDDRNDKYSSIVVFDIFLRGYNFGKLLYDKIVDNRIDVGKSLFIYSPMDSSFKYWVKIGILDDLYARWIEMYDGDKTITNENIEQNFRGFLSEQLHWEDVYIDIIIHIDKILHYYYDDGYTMEDSNKFTNHYIKYESVMKEINDKHYCEYDCQYDDGSSDPDKQ